MQQWFNNLTRQEQLMLLLGSFAVLVYIIYVIILRPLSDKADLLATQNVAAAQTLATVKALAEEYKQLEKSGASAGSNQKSNLTRLIDSTVKKNNLVMQRFQPSSSGDIQVRLENAVFNDVVAWLGELELDYLVVIKDLSITPAQGSGIVNVSVRLNPGS
jgi:general secretion pathway protein M